MLFDKILVKYEHLYSELHTFNGAVQCGQFIKHLKLEIVPPLRERDVFRSGIGVRVKTIILSHAEKSVALTLF